MANVETVGWLNFVKVGSLVDTWDYGILQIREAATGIPWTFVLWFAEVQASAFDRILQGMQLSLLRESASTQLRVHITHDEASNQVLEVRIDGIGT